MYYMYNNKCLKNVWVHLGGVKLESKSITTKSLVFTALSIALVAVCTIMVRIYIPATTGYVNFGDIMIFAVAITLGKKKGAIAGGLGSCLADILVGAMIFAPGTLIIKGIEGFLCGLLYEKISKRFKNILAICISCIIAGAFMVFAYFIYELIIFSLEGAMGGLPGNIVQGIVSVVAAVPISMVFRKATKAILHEHAA